MKQLSDRDSLYLEPRQPVGDFEFDADVARVFPDMVRRSVPGYPVIVALLGILAARHVQPHTPCYDLGCSLGAASLSMVRHIQQPGCRIVGVDKSPAMLQRCREMPPNPQAFDTVFSMGVLHHQRSPFDHLLQLRSCLRSGGELILETLVIDGDAGQVLVPQDRYAKMRNVWFIPSCAALHAWLERCNWRNVRLIHVTATTPGEQRRTDWMTFESLADYLDPHNPLLTVEGLPPPRRAIFLANAP